MNFQINFLKKTERRYQGVVSMKVMVIGSLSVLVGITGLVLTLAAISKISLNADLGRVRSEWGRLSPQAARIQNWQACTATNQQTIARLESWTQGGQLFVHKVLRGIQSEIPDQMALGNLFVGMEEAADPAAGPSHRVVRFSGRAVGEMTSVEARRRLNENSVLRGYCGDIRLISSQRESGENWIFALEGRLPVEGGQP